MNKISGCKIQLQDPALQLPGLWVHSQLGSSAPVCTLRCCGITSFDTSVSTPSQPFRLLYPRAEGKAVPVATLSGCVDPDCLSS